MSKPFETTLTGFETAKATAVKTGSISLKDGSPLKKVPARDDMDKDQIKNYIIEKKIMLVHLVGRPGSTYNIYCAAFSQAEGDCPLQDGPPSFQSSA